MPNAAAPWIACRFLESDRVAGLPDDANELTGKWSFHLWADWKRSECPGWEPAYSNGLEYFSARLQAVL